MFAVDVEKHSLQLPARLTAETLQGQDFSQALNLPPQLTIDAAALAVCDSAGIAALLWLSKQAQQQDCQLLWQNLAPSVRNLLQLYELDKQGLIDDARAAH